MKVNTLPLSIVRITVLVIIGGFYCLVPFHWASAAEKAPVREATDYETISFYFENDAFFGTDYLYTNGFKLSWTSADLENYREDSGVGAWAYSLIDQQPFANDPKFGHFVSLSLGQNMYTPEDTDSTELVEDQRPYAGLRYMGLGYSSRSSYRANTWEMILGVVGPSSYAEETQRTVHNWFSYEVPKGWDNQLENEIVLNLFYEHKWKFLHAGMGGDWAYDVVTNLGAALGNLYIGALGGAQIRLGWRLPSDFGSSLIRPGMDTNAPLDKKDPRFFEPLRRYSIHIFAGLEGTYVLRNLTLDGNTFEDSHSVDKEPLVRSYRVGVGATLYRFKISLAHIRQSEEYKAQEKDSEYGSITISYIY